jgi:LPXTG-motif cell wall-anchored protein
MKKGIIILSLSVVLAFTGVSTASSQEAPGPQQDTVNMDTDAKPTFYYAVEDEEAAAEETSGKSSTGLIAIIAGAVIIVGGAAIFLLRKKK